MARRTGRETLERVERRDGGPGREALVDTVGLGRRFLGGAFLAGGLLAGALLAGGCSYVCSHDWSSRCWPGPRVGPRSRCLEKEPCLEPTPKPCPPRATPPSSPPQGSPSAPAPRPCPGRSREDPRGILLAKISRRR